MENQDPKVWLESLNLKCKRHKTARRGCPECRTHRDAARAVENGTRSHITLQKKIKAEQRDKLEAKIKLAEDEGRKWGPLGPRCKIHRDKRCRCQELARLTFDTPEERADFIEENKAKIQALGI